VDFLINNAGFGDVGAFARADPARLAGMVHLNAGAVVDLTRAFLPGMLERDRGRIINVASTAAFQPCPFFAVYSASKAFVLTFTEALHDELAGTGVRVQVLCPGLTSTEFQEVAHTENVALNKTPAMTAQAVVDRSLAGLDRKQLRVIVGWQNRLTVAAQRFAPRALVRKVAGSLMRPPD
jgi:short-subunit dehydrogenase